MTTVVLNSNISKMHPTYLNKLPEELLLLVGSYYQDPNHIIHLRQVYAEGIFAEREKVRDFIKQAAPWKQYFHQMFTRDSQAVFSKSILTEDNLCQKVCKLAHTYYGYSDPFRLTKDYLTYPAHVLQKAMISAAESGYAIALNHLIDNAFYESKEREVEKVMFQVLETSSQTMDQETFTRLYKEYASSVYMGKKIKESQLCDLMFWGAYLGEKTHLAALVKKGAKLGWPIYRLGFHEETVLHVATALGHIEVMEELVGLGANIDEQDRDDDTPLHKAVSSPFLKKKQRGKVIETCLALGANPEITNAEGETPIEIASEDLQKFFIQARGQKRKRADLDMEKQ